MNRSPRRSRGDDDAAPAIEMTVSASSDDQPVISMEQVADGTRRFLHRFFYPTEGKKLKKGVRVVSEEEEAGESSDPHQQQQHADPLSSPPSSPGHDAEDPGPEHNPALSSSAGAGGAPEPSLPTPSNPNHRPRLQQQRGAARAGETTTDKDADQTFVHNFWTTYDDILILSIFTQVGIVFRLASSSWMANFDGVFRSDSALFVNLPLNCLSCFVLGMLGSGERLLEIIHTRFAPPRTQQAMVQQQQNLLNGSRDEEELSPILEGEEDSGGEADGLNGNGNHHHHSLPPIHHHSHLPIRRRRHRKKKEPHFVSWQPPVHLNEELRDVQLLALERRIRMSRCLLLFPVRKQDVDVMEHYFHQGYKKNDNNRSFEYDDDDEGDFDLALRESSGRSSLSVQEEEEDPGAAADEIDETAVEESQSPAAAASPKGGFRNDSSELNSIPVEEVDRESAAADISHEARPSSQSPALPRNGDNDDPLTGSLERMRQSSQLGGGGTNGAASSNTINTNAEADGDESCIDDDNDPESMDRTIAEFTTNVQENVQENFDRLRRVNLADGWDSGTTAEEMSDDLMLGLRDGFCGALSSFSSWNSSMVSLLRNGQIGEAFVGYMLGLQLPIIAYRFGQHVAVYVFIWRTRRETRKDERRGYGIRISMDEESERIAGEGVESDEDKEDEEEKPSVRAIFTAIFLMALVTQCTSISFFNDPDDQLIALSLLFSPFGVLARWRLSKLNSWRPTFPIGTFIANIAACALSGSLGTLLAGNPGPEERIVLVSFIAGFGGTLSSLATFVVEILAGVDPILFRFDGMIYAVVSIGCALVVGFVFSASVEWADQTVSDSEDAVTADMTNNSTLLFM